MLNIKQVTTPNKCVRSVWDGKNWIPDVMVYHIADGFETAVNSMQNPASGVSSHFFIAKSGAVTQLVPLNYAAYTQGVNTNASGKTPMPKQATNALVVQRGLNPNAYAISIEFEGFYNTYPNIKGSIGCKGAITTEQVNSTIALMPYINSELKRLYGDGHSIKFDRLHNMGHCEINPSNRSCCPGELFPYDKIINGYKTGNSITEDTKPTTPPVNPVTPPSNNTGIKTFKLKNQNLYSSAAATIPSKKITGTFYQYDSFTGNDRIRITNSVSNVGKTPTGNYVTGYINCSENAKELVAGSQVKLSNDSLFASSTSNVAKRKISGTYFLYDGKLFSNRYRICSTATAVGKSINNVMGYVNKSDI